MRQPQAQEECANCGGIGVIYTMEMPEPQTCPLCFGTGILFTISRKSGELERSVDDDGWGDEGDNEAA